MKKLAEWERVCQNVEMFSAQVGWKVIGSNLDISGSYWKALKLPLVKNDNSLQKHAMQLTQGKKWVKV